MNRWPLLCTWALFVAGASPSWATPGTQALVRDALASAVQARMGEDVDVTIDQLRVVTPVPVGQGQLVAEPQPGSQVGTKARFALRLVGDDGRLYAGVAECVVRVTGDVVRVRHPVARGQIITPVDVDVSRGDVGRGPMQPLVSDFDGARARRALRAGEPLRPALVDAASTVRRGDRLVVRVRVGEVEVTTAAIASQHGQVGEVIRAVNADSGRPLRVRITGPAEGEVIHAS